MTTNFDIYNIINKADGKDRAIIFFDELLNMSICNKSKFSDAEMESLSNSFKSNGDINLYNSYLHNSIYSLLLIAEIEKEIIRIEYLKTYLRFYNLSKDDKGLIDYLLSETSKILQKDKNNADKKQIKKALKELLESINKMCFVLFSDDVVKSFVNKIFKESESADLDCENSDYYEKMFIKFFTDSVSRKTEISKAKLTQLKTKFESFEVRFEVVEDKIKELEIELEKHKLSKEN